jgi:hypothetical protein
MLGLLGLVLSLGVFMMEAMEHIIIYLKKKKKEIEVFCVRQIVLYWFVSYLLSRHQCLCLRTEPWHGMWDPIHLYRYWLSYDYITFGQSLTFSHDLPNGSRGPTNKRNTTDLPTRSIRDSFIQYTNSVFVKHKLATIARTQNAQKLRTMV